MIPGEGTFYTNIWYLIIVNNSFISFFIFLSFNNAFKRAIFVTFFKFLFAGVFVLRDILRFAFLRVFIVALNFFKLVFEKDCFDVY